MSKQKPVQSVSTGGNLLGWIVGMIFVAFFIGWPAVLCGWAVSGGHPVLFVVMSAVVGVLMWSLLKLLDTRSKRIQAAKEAVGRIEPKEERAKTPVSRIAVALGWLILVAICAITYLAFRAGFGPALDWIALPGMVGLVLLVLWGRRTERALVGLMTERRSSGHGAVESICESIAQSPQIYPAQPVPPLAVNVVSVNDLPVPSPAALALAERTQSQFDARQYLVARGVHVSAVAALILFVMFWSDTPLPFAVVAVTILMGCAVWIAMQSSQLRRQVLVYPPLKLLFLWVFGSRVVQNSVRANLGKVWLHLGTVQLLKGAGFIVGMGEMVATLKGRADERVEETPDEVIARINAFRMTPDWLGRYRLNSILCADAVWQLALYTLLADADVVLVNLGGFSRKNRGVVYELGQLIDRLPTQRFLLIADETTDIEFLTDTLRQAWEMMATNSPNHRPDAAPVCIFKVEQLNKPYDYQTGKGDGQYVDEYALQKEIYAIFQLLCEGVVQEPVQRRGL